MIPIPSPEKAVFLHEQGWKCNQAFFLSFMVGNWEEERKSAQRSVELWEAIAIDIVWRMSESRTAFPTLTRNLRNNNQINLEPRS